MKDVLVHEVGPRDGLQVEKTTVPTDQKIAWIEAIMQSGVDMIQVGSFVHPEKVPQMADTDSLFRHFSRSARKPARVTLSGLVLNEKGLERAIDCGVEMICMGVSASETHSQKNTGMSIADATRRICAMAKGALSDGKRVQASAQSAFGCGFEGPVPRERVLDIVRQYLDAGVRQISLADTAGHAHPMQTEELFGAVAAMDSEIEMACHFHNTYGLGLANCFAALRVGVTVFESGFAGLGGCPFTKQPAGNVCTEDLVHGLQRMGMRRDIRLDALLEIARDVGRFFGREMPGLVLKSGSIADFRKV